MGTVTKLRTRQTQTLSGAAERFLDTKDLTSGTHRVYGATFAKLVEDLGDQDVAEVTADEVEDHLRSRYGKRGIAPATFNRNRSAISALFTFAEQKAWCSENPVATVQRRKPRKTAMEAKRAEPIPYRKLDALWSKKSIPLREKTLWRMLYETAARANEVLSLDIEDLDLAERSATVIGKGGGVETIHWATGTARLLPRLIGDRTAGPIFLTDRAARQPTATSDLDPETGRARLSYRRAAELFSEHSGGWTLHQLRHSAISHWAEEGVDVTMLKAKSRHQSLRSLERYSKPSQASVAKLTAELDPEGRKRRSR